MLQPQTNPLQIRGTVLGAGFPKICVPLVEQTREALIEKAKEAVSKEPDLIEWRADFCENLSAPGELGTCLEELRAAVGQIPLIFTIRTVDEGGNFNGGLSEYEKLLRRAAETGQSDLIDVEYFRREEQMRKVIQAVHDAGVRVIASNHNFQTTFSKNELVRRMKEMDLAGADVLKVAMMPNNFDQVCDLLKATREMVQEHTKRPVVSMSMSEMGRISRYSGEIFGSCMTFAAVGKTSAPGQEDIGSMKTALQFYHDNFA